MSPITLRKALVCIFILGVFQLALLFWVPITQLQGLDGHLTITDALSICNMPFSSTTQSPSTHPGYMPYRAANQDLCNRLQATYTSGLIIATILLGSCLMGFILLGINSIILKIKEKNEPLSVWKYPPAVPEKTRSIPKVVQERERNRKKVSIAFFLFIFLISIGAFIFFSSYVSKWDYDLHTKLQNAQNGMNSSQGQNSSAGNTTPLHASTTTVKPTASIQSAVNTSVYNRSSSLPASPKYAAGDLINWESMNNNIIWIILAYYPKADEYQYTIYNRSSGEVLGEYSSWGKRDIIDANWVKIGHIEPYISTPLPTTPSETPLASSQQVQTVKTYEPLVVVVGSEILNIRILDYARGPYANDLAAKVRANKVPQKNFEYLLINPVVTNEKGKSPIHVSERDFKACVVNTSDCYNSLSTALPTEEFGDVYLEQGDKSDGWISFIIPHGVDIELAYVRSMNNSLGFILIK